MSTLTVPDNLFPLIEECARANGKSVDAQAADMLAKALAEETREAELMSEIRQERELLAKRGAFLTDDLIRQAKNWGRK